jgi:hypothetical protein
VTLRQDMLRAARQASETLGEAAGLVRAFVAGQRHPDGGYRNRDGQPDLYYTVFGLSAACALDSSPAAAPERLPEAFLASPANLSLVNLASLARGLALTRHADPAVRGTLRVRLESLRAADGSFATKPGAARGTMYGSFLALGAAEDLTSDAPATPGVPLSDAGRLADAVLALRLSDGSFANDHVFGVATVPSTGAAVAILHRIGVSLPQPAHTGDWLLAQTLTVGSATGWAATPGTPTPDLLSTAVALDALARLNIPLGQALRAGVEEFVDSLWSSDGTRAGFCGTWADDIIDVEYTCYGLIALGFLRGMGTSSVSHVRGSTPCP